MDYFGPDVTETDPGSKRRKSVSDAYGRLIEVTEDPGGPKQFITKYRYDALDQLLGVCQGGTFQSVGATQVCSNGLSRSFQYDSLKRLKEANNPETGVVSYTYDLAGNLKSRTQGGRTVNYTTYDVLNRLTAKSYSDGTPGVSYVWDTVFKGRLSEVSNSVSKTSFGAYDAMGRVTASTQTTPPSVTANAKVFGYSYNLAGGLEQEVYPSMRTVKTCYDTQGRPAKVTQKANASSAEADVAKAEAVGGVPAYAPHGGLLSLKLGPSGAVEEKTLYNSRMQPYRMSAGAWQTDLFYCAGATDPAASCTSNNGNIHKQVLQALNGVTYTAGYTYDPINRLKTAIETRPGTPNPVENWRQTFVYDPYGNRAELAEAGRLATMEGATVSVPSETPPVWPFNAKNQWTGAAFDLSGNQETTWGPNGTDARAAKFVFDGENRIATATVTNGVGAVSYGYDGDGRRVTSTVGGMTTTFVYDAFGSMVAEYGAALGNSGCLSCLVTVDHLGSTRVVWDAAGGAPVRLYDYSPFGEEVNATLRAGDTRYPAPMYPVSTRNDVSPMFTGKERDAETGLDYFLARYMSSAQGRFTSPDPLLSSGREGNPQTWNRYAYAGNNPLRFVDPDGLDYYDSRGNLIGPSGDDKNYVVSDPEEVKRIQSQRTLTPVSVSDLKSTLLMPGATVVSAMDAAIARSNSPTGDDRVGGFHEEGGLWGTTADGSVAVVQAKAGPVSPPGGGAQIDLSVLANPADQGKLLKIQGEFHVHPAGTRMVGRQFAMFGQMPSPGDREGWDPSRLNVVVGAKSQRAVFYTNKVEPQAVIPMTVMRVEVTCSVSVREYSCAYVAFRSCCQPQRLQLLRPFPLHTRCVSMEGFIMAQLQSPF